VRYLEHLPPPNPFDPFQVYRPPGRVQQGRDPTIAIELIPGREFDDVSGKRSFFGSPLGHLALRGSMLPQNPAREMLRHTELAHDVLDAAPPPGGA